MSLLVSLPLIFEMVTLCLEPSDLVKLDRWPASSRNHCLGLPVTGDCRCSRTPCTLGIKLKAPPPSPSDTPPQKGHTYSNKATPPHRATPCEPLEVISFQTTTPAVPPSSCLANLLVLQVRKQACWLTVELGNR